MFCMGLDAHLVCCLDTSGLTERANNNFLEMFCARASGKQSTHVARMFTHVCARFFDVYVHLCIRLIRFPPQARIPPFRELT